MRWQDHSEHAKKTQHSLRLLCMPVTTPGAQWLAKWYRQHNKPSYKPRRYDKIHDVHSSPTDKYACKPLTGHIDQVCIKPFLRAGLQRACTWAYWTERVRSAGRALSIVIDLLSKQAFKEPCIL